MSQSQRSFLPGPSLWLKVSTRVFTVTESTKTPFMLNRHFCRCDIGTIGFKTLGLPNNLSVMIFAAASLSETSRRFGSISSMHPLLQLLLADDAGPAEGLIVQVLLVPGGGAGAGLQGAVAAHGAVVLEH